MAPSFEKHLFKTSRAVYVDGMSETATSVSLLDILIKTESEGTFARRPVLESAGTMVQLGSAASCEVTKEQLRKALSNFEERRGDELIKWTREHGVIVKKVSSASSLMASLLGLAPFAQAGAHFVRAKGLTIKIENPETASFEKGKLLDVVVNEKLWKPDINNGRLQWSSHGAKRVRKVWVVHQLLYASKLEVTIDASVSGGAQLVCSLVPATPGLGLEASSGSANELVGKVGKNSKFPGKFMYAYRAVRFQFDAEGNLVSFQNNVGKVMPVTRGDADDGPYADEHEQIRELFEVPPTESDFEDDDDDDDVDEDGEEDKDEGDEDDVEEEESAWDGKPLLIRDGARDENSNLS